MDQSNITQQIADLQAQIDELKKFQITFNPDPELLIQLKEILTKIGFSYP